MANAVWPLTLPQYVSSEGLSEKPPELTLKTDMDAGGPKRRRRYTAGEREINCHIQLTNDETAILDDFYTNTLASGSLPFDWIHPRTHSPATFFIDEEPDISLVRGNIWRANLKLKMTPESVLPGIYDDDVYGDGDIVMFDANES